MPIDNPYSKRKRVEKLKPKVVKPRCGHAQEAFIVKTRKSVDGDPFFFHNNDWNRISIGGGRGIALANPKRLSVDSFYVKGIAVWVPHLIIPNYVPSCSRCHSKAAVDIEKSSWVENVKTVCCVFTHRYFDTKYYWCHDCKGSFLGWNEQTLLQDANEIAGVLNFRMSKGFAVDEELCSYIVTHTNDTTASTHQRLKKSIADNWMNDATFYCRAVLGNCVKRQNVNYLEGTNQQTLDRHLAPLEELTPAERKAKRLRESLASAEEKLEKAMDKAAKDVQFVDIFNKKKNQNATGLPFKGIGKEKCWTLMNHGVLSAKDLLAHDEGNPAMLESWKDIVQAYYDHLNREVYILRRKRDERAEELKEELDLQRSILAVDIMLDGTTDTTTTAAEKEKAPPEPDLIIPAFSNIRDAWHYNARLISKSTIDRIKASDYQRRKSMQEAKMRALTGEAWKIDWAHKIAPKIKVWNGKGKGFAPFKACCRSRMKIRLPCSGNAIPARRESMLWNMT